MQPIKNDRGMNKTEAKYADILELQYKDGNIISYHFEEVKFKIGERCWYTPDFLVVCQDHFEVHEVKGFMRDDARVKIKAARYRYPFFNWFLCYFKNKKIGWDIQEVK